MLKWLGVIALLSSTVLILIIVLLVNHFVSQEKQIKRGPENQGTSGMQMAQHASRQKIKSTAPFITQTGPDSSIDTANESNASTKILSQPNAKSSPGLRALNYLMAEPIERIELCHLDCTDLESAFNRYQSYFRGQFSTDDESIHSDPAFQLACAFNQAALGPVGKELFKLFSEIQDNPYSWSSFELLKFTFRIDDIYREFEERGISRAYEADTFISRLKNAVSSCNIDVWKSECRDFENDLSSWIVDGALK